MKTTLSYLAALVSVAAFVQPLAAHAESTDSEARSVLVRYGDLDLRAEAGAKTLLTRLNTAGSKACRASARGVMAVKATLNCRTEAVKQAVADVNAPLVTAAYEGGARTIVVASK